MSIKYSASTPRFGPATSFQCMLKCYHFYQLVWWSLQWSHLGKIWETNFKTIIYILNMECSVLQCRDGQLPIPQSSCSIALCKYWLDRWSAALSIVAYGQVLSVAFPTEFPAFLLLLTTHSRIVVWWCKPPKLGWSVQPYSSTNGIKLCASV